MTDRPAELTVDDRTIAVAVAQFAPGDDRVHNRDVVAGLIAVAASRGARPSIHRVRTPSGTSSRTSAKQ